MADRLRWCASHAWSVSVITGTDIQGARLSVCRHLTIRGKWRMLRGDADGMMFPTSEAAWAYVHSRGYCDRFEIPFCTTCRVRHTTQYGDRPARRSAYCPVTQSTTFRC